MQSLRIQRLGVLLRLVHRDQWFKQMTTNTKNTVIPCFYKNNIPTIVDCGINDYIQTVSKLAQQRKQLYRHKRHWLCHALVDPLLQKCHFFVMWQHKKSCPATQPGWGQGEAARVGDVGTNVISWGSSLDPSCVRCWLDTRCLKAAFVCLSCD